MAKKNGATTDATASDASATHQPLTIQGVVFQAPLRYAEGHIINAVEAQTLNQVLSENLRNNFATNVAKAIKDAGEAGISDETRAELVAKFDEYASTYVFHGKRASKPALDPVEREAHKLAKSSINEALRAANIDAKSVTEEQMDSLIADLLASESSLREEAKRRVEATKSAAALAIGRFQAPVSGAVAE